MRLTLSFYGSRGDIQPGVCLGLELMRRGHQVTVLVPPNYVSFVESSGLIACPVGDDSEAYWDSDRSHELLTTKNPARKVQLARRQIADGFARFDADLAREVKRSAAGTGVDGLITGPLGQERVYALAELLGVPVATMRFCAMSENGSIGAIPTSRSMPPALNRASWRAADTLTWVFGRSAENRFRAGVGLPPATTRLPRRLTRDAVLQIQAYDPVFFPGLSDEWGADKPLVGFLDLPADARDALGEEVDAGGQLRDWVGDGEAPLFVSFGSAPLSDPRAVFDAIVSTARVVGVRMLVVGIPGRPPGIDSTVPEIYVAERVNHAAVMPRCRAAVHHGGAGTTAASLRAGLPTMVCAAGADQAHWGAQVRCLGVGTSTRLSRLDADALVAGVQPLLLSATARRAQAVASAMISPEQAVASAVDAIESAFDRSAV